MELGWQSNGDLWLHKTFCAVARGFDYGIRKTFADIVSSHRKRLTRVGRAISESNYTPAQAYICSEWSRFRVSRLCYDCHLRLGLKFSEIDVGLVSDDPLLFKLFEGFFHIDKSLAMV